MRLEQLSTALFYPVLVLFGLMVFFIIVAFIKKKQAWPYEAVPVMSPIEKKFYWQLKRVFPTYHILAQVQLSQVIRPPRGKNEYKWLNKIWRMSLDYVVLDENLELVTVLELDDRSHLYKRRQEADQRKNKALKAAGVRLIRIQTNTMPTDAQLVNLFKGRS